MQRCKNREWQRSSLFYHQQQMFKTTNWKDLNFGRIYATFQKDRERKKERERDRQSLYFFFWIKKMAGVGQYGKDKKRK